MIAGWIEPACLNAREGFVAYSMSVVNYIEATGDKEWISGGYFANETGAYYYLEYHVDGVYKEQSIGSVAFKKDISVILSDIASTGAWMCVVTCGLYSLQDTAFFSDDTIYVSSAVIKSNSQKNYTDARFA